MNLFHQLVAIILLSFIIYILPISSVLFSGLQAPLSEQEDTFCITSPEASYIPGNIYTIIIVSLQTFVFKLNKTIQNKQTSVHTHTHSSYGTALHEIVTAALY